MPACLNTNHCSLHCRPAVKSLAEFPIDAPSSGCLRIGLINNMPDAALEATERQFLSLLDSASEGIQIQLLFFALPNVPRNELGARRVKSFYSGIENLWGTSLDGLIVTG